MSSPPVHRVAWPWSLGAWIVAAVVLICTVLVILIVAGLGVSPPAWVLFALLGVGLLGAVFIP